MPRICVFAGSCAGRDVEYRRVAERLGHLMANRGIGLVYGGASVGLMGALANAVLSAGGEAIGVIPASLVAKELAHDGLTDLRVVVSMHERKAMMADLADGFIALPGGWGTLEELFEALTWAQLGLHRKPCGLLNVQAYFDRLLAFIDHSIEEGFVRPEYRSVLSIAADPATLLDQLGRSEPPTIDKWIDRASAV